MGMRGEAHRSRRGAWSDPTAVLFGVSGATYVDDDAPLSVAEAARLLGRDRTRVYALLRSGTGCR